MSRKPECNPTEPKAYREDQLWGLSVSRSRDYGHADIIYCRTEWGTVVAFSLPEE